MQGGNESYNKTKIKVYTQLLINAMWIIDELLNEFYMVHLKKTYKFLFKRKGSYSSARPLKFFVFLINIKFLHLMQPKYKSWLS